MHLYVGGVCSFLCLLPVFIINSVCVCLCVSECMCVGVCGHPPLVCLTTERGCGCCVCVCVSCSFYPQFRCEGTRIALVFWGGAQEHVGRICVEPLSPLHPHVIL